MALFPTTEDKALSGCTGFMNAALGFLFAAIPSSLVEFLFAAAYIKGVVVLLAVFLNFYWLRSLWV
jgi:hypothetical protein